MLLKTENKGDDIVSYFDSSNLPKAIYSRKHEAAIIYFIRERSGVLRGNQYLIKELPESVYRQFENAESQGRFYRTNIGRNSSYSVIKSSSIDLYSSREILEEIRSLKNKKKIDE